jgi:hypothetical protein
LIELCTTFAIDSGNMSEHFRLSTQTEGGLMRQSHVFSGTLDKSDKGIVLHGDDGHDLVLRKVEGLDKMIGRHVVVLGVVNEDKTINAFRIQRDACESLDDE